MKVVPESITLAIAGADVTIGADALADLWIKKLAQEIAVQAPAYSLSIPELSVGEIYLGGIIDPCGTKVCHTILLPGERENINWNDAITWAAKLGGDLLDRVELALAFSTMKDQFEPSWYWSNTQSSTDNAWNQAFYDGYQVISNKESEGRARACRRLFL